MATTQTAESSLPSTTLYYRQGASDKVYHVAIEPQADGYIVRFAFGRRGSTLQTGCKTASPVSLDAARKIYDKLVGEKTAKGYSPGPDGTPYQDTPKQDRRTAILPQLLNSIEEEQAQKLMADPAWLTQEKLDGRRVLVRRSGDEVVGINRSGLIISLPGPIVTCALSIGSRQFLLDGECIGDTYIAFDLLQRACVDLRDQPLRQRLEALYDLPLAGPGLPIQFIRSATRTSQKRAMMAELRGRRAEGIVFKRIDAPYSPGRPASGGDQLKLKFTATASCLVAAANGDRRSVKLELLDGGRRVAVGNVTIPPSVAVPPAGQVVEVRYLYAHEGGALFQPVYLGIRDDLSPSACTVEQLKLKAQQTAEEQEEEPH